MAGDEKKSKVLGDTGSSQDNSGPLALENS
jgi:hypothetical protein